MIIPVPQTAYNRNIKEVVVAEEYDGDAAERMLVQTYLDRGEAPEQLFSQVYQELRLQLGPEATIAYILITPGNDLPLDHLDGYQIGLMRNEDDILAVPKYAYELLGMHIRTLDRNQAGFREGGYSGLQGPSLAAGNP
jgi:hypothetical protein